MKNLHSSKRSGRVSSGARKERAKKLIQMHIDDPNKQPHNHHSKLKTRFVNQIVQLEDRMKTWERGKCYTHQEMRKKKMIGRGKKSGYSRSGWKFLDIVLGHPQTFHDAMTKLAHENQGIKVGIYVH